ncbi:O-antigen ligase family protein [Bacteroidota bacterium]
MLLLAASLPLSVYTTSVIQFLLIINWVLEGQYKEKWKRIRSSKVFLIYSVYFILHLAGMLWTSDSAFGMKILKIILPLIILPFLIVSSEAFSKKEIRNILTLFISGTLIASFASVLALSEAIPIKIEYFRTASIFVHHIRFSLMVVLSIMFAAYFLSKRIVKDNVYVRILFWITIVWLPVFLFILKALSGIVIILVLLFIISLQLATRIREHTVRFMVQVMILFIPIFVIIYTGNAINRFYTIEQVDFSQLDSVTIQGSPYVHDKHNKEIENGRYVWIYICPEELKSEWEKVSDLGYEEQTESGDPVKFTLIRYLTSKGLRKDAAGISQLSEEDIKAIENGVANYIYLNRFAFYPRIYQVIWEIDRYKLGHTANDKSLVQRYYYMKAGFHIVKEHPVFGVGTGDGRIAYDRYYEKVNSSLRNDRRRMAHNQYLTLAIQFGFAGLLLCLLAIFLPIFVKRKWSSYMVQVFIITMALSMLDEDTLASTTGAVMFGLFYALFVFGENWSWKEKEL